MILVTIENGDRKEDVFYFIFVQLDLQKVTSGGPKQWKVGNPAGGGMERSK